MFWRKFDGFSRDLFKLDVMREVLSIENLELVCNELYVEIILKKDL